MIHNGTVLVESKIVYLWQFSTLLMFFAKCYYKGPTFEHEQFSKRNTCIFLLL